ncbi:MAG: efflux RND transporter permease subunit [Bacillota bacterium]|nr:efflux RND transporter permease subunit [Bacillota bacterium]
MSLPSLSVKRPVTTIVLVAMVLILGWVAVGRLAIDLLPRIVFPQAAIMTTYRGASPSEIENLVTRPIEAIVGTVNNVKNIYSFSLADTSVVAVEFEWGTDMDFATLAIREKVDMIKRYLPEDIEPPMVVKADPSMMPIMQIGVYGRRNLASLKKLVDDEIRPKLERVEGVASVLVTGGLDREIQIRLDQQKLAQYGISPSQVVQALRAENVTLPGGYVVENERELTIRTMGEFESLREVAELVVAVPGGPSVRLNELGQVVDSFADVRNHSRVNGRPSIGIMIQKQSSANTVLVARRIKKELARLERSVLPKDVHLSLGMDQSEFIERSINNVKKNAFQGGVLAISVLFFFLRHLVPTAIIGLAIPFSIVCTFVLMYFGKLTLNLMSLGGLALGVGMMVDNAIVVLENIYRYRQEGHSITESAIKGAEEVSTAIQASTLTNLVVFLPIVFVQGLAAMIFKEMALTVTYSLLASLVVALTLVPVMASRWLRRVRTHATGLSEEEYAWHTAGRLGRWYYGVLGAALRHRKLVIGLAVFAFLTSFIPWALVEKEFMPPMDAREISVRITMPKGTRLENTDQVVREVERLIAEQPETDTVMVSVGGGNLFTLGLDSGTENATLEVRLKKGAAARQGRSTEDVVDYLRQEVRRIAGAKIQVTKSGGGLMGGGGFGAPVQIRIKGDNLAVLANLADGVVRRISRIPGIREADSSLSEGRPEVQVYLRRDKAAAYGLNAALVAQAVRTAIGGEVATRYRVGGDEVDVRVRLDQKDRQSLADLTRVRVASPAGVQLPLYEVADVRPGMGPNQINRMNQSRYVTITAQIHNRFSGAVIRDVSEALKGYPMPEGYRLEFGGEAENMQESFGDLGLAFILAAALVYIIMAAQFESFLYPFIIMFTVPMAFIGVAWTLFLCGKSLSLYAIIGGIMLAGIVVNNAIVLVDFTNTLRSRGYQRDEALRRAGPTRLRPILMTTLTTVLGLVPMALGLGEGAEAESPLALVLIGGLATSTLLTLVLVPVIYTLFDDAGRWLVRVFSREPAATPATPGAS